MDKASWILNAAKSKLQEAFEQHVQPLTQPLAHASPLQQRRSGGGLPPPQHAHAIQAGSIQSLEARVAKFKHELLAENIDLQQLKRMAFHGIPDKDGLRAITWKLLLDYLPADTACWEQKLAGSRKQYGHFCEELIIDPKRQHSSGSGPLDASTSSTSSSNGMDPLAASAGSIRAEDVTHDDHPLALTNTSKWNTFFKDNEIKEQIERDVMRTHPDMHFFSGDTPAAEQHRMELKRMLFIYAKLNPGLRYIQGMNELLAPIYFLFRMDTDRASVAHAEADAFFCFVNLLSEFQDLFCQQLDNSSSGIKATIRRLMELLAQLDYSLWSHLEARNKVDPQFYAFRWITLLLTQEFPFPDAVRIWDTILSDPNSRLDCLLRICLAMLLNVRDQLLQGDFAQNVKLLQHYPATDVNVLLHRAACLPSCEQIAQGMR